MFEFLKRFKIRDRAAQRRSLLEGGITGTSNHDSDPIDTILSTIVTQEILSTELSTSFDPDADTSSIDPDSGDPGSEFDSGGGESGGGGADGDW